MSDFMINKDMFGRYCKIETDYSRDLHTYKIVSLIESNSYCDIPLTVNSKETLHDKIVSVLLVIHCGIDESKVRRVALSDCDVQPESNVVEVKRGEWIELPSNGIGNTAECSVCHDSVYGYESCDFCPNCGADMRGDKR